VQKRKFIMGDDAMAMGAIEAGVKVVTGMEEVTEICRKAGVAVGTFITKPEDAKHWADRGIQYLMYSTDAGMMVQVSKDRLQALTAALK